MSPEQSPKRMEKEAIINLARQNLKGKIVSSVQAGLKGIPLAIHSSEKPRGVYFSSIEEFFGPYFHKEDVEAALKPLQEEVEEQRGKLVRRKIQTPRGDTGFTGWHFVRDEAYWDEIKSFTDTYGSYGLQFYIESKNK